MRNQARAEALMDVATLGQFQDDLTAARAYAQEGIAIFRELKPEERGELGLALAEYGLIMAFLGEHEGWKRAAEEGISLLRQTGHKWGLSVALFIRGLIANAKGDFASARATLEESMALSRETGNKWFLAQALNSLGDISRIIGDFARAKELYEESLSLFRRLNTRTNIPASFAQPGACSPGTGSSGRCQATVH